MAHFSPPFTLRPAEKGDIASLLELIRGIAEYAKMTDQLEATAERLETALFGEKPTARALVAKVPDNPELVGYAIFFYSFSTFLAKPGIFLEDLYVRSEYRGQGIGSALFKQVAKIAAEEDCGRMEWMTLDWNTPALEFYKAQGAQCLENWRLHRFTHSDLVSISEGR